MLHHHRLFILITAIALVLLACGKTPAAGPAAAKAAAKAILEKGWDNTQASRDLVDREFAAVEAQSQGDPFLLGAHWMALAHQNQYKKSLGSLDAFLKNAPGYAPYLQAKVWICTVLKEYPKAMDAANALAAAIGQNPPAADPAAQAAQEQAMEFLGAFVGFLEEPLEDTFDQAHRKKFEADLLKLLDASRKEQFQRGKEAVFAKLETLQKAAVGEEAEQKERAEAAKKKKLDSLEKDRDKIADDDKNAEARAKKAADDLRGVLEKLNRQLNTEGDRITRLQNQFNQLQTQLNQDQANARQARQIANQRPNDQFAQRDAQQKESTARDTQFQVNKLSNQIITAQANHKAIQQQIQTANAGGAIQGQQLDNERQRLGQDKLRNENRTKREQGKENNPKALALEAEARSFRTYATLSLDDLREALLKRLQ